eukprot:768010-Hanusia_phi.AAC.2
MDVYCVEAFPALEQDFRRKELHAELVDHLVGHLAHAPEPHAVGFVLGPGDVHVDVCGVEGFD